MKLVIQPSQIQAEDGFNNNDLFKRKSFGEALTNLIGHSNDELVISLDGQWGEGKTTFVKMWQGHLKEHGIPSIYIDAFQNDYTEDAFISIASTINSFAEQNSENTVAKKQFKAKAKKVGVHLLSWGTKVAIKAATLGAIKEADIDALTDIEDDIAGTASEKLSNFVKEKLESHSLETEIFRSFKDSLAELPSKLKDNASGRLVIIIDELDRCKPSFAIEILEKIKHLFSVQNVVFLLVINKGQLEEAIKHVYGQNIDAHTYLQKFINVETTIPKRIKDKYQNDLTTYSKKLLELHELNVWGDRESLLTSVDILTKHFNCTLRQLEKIFTNIAIIYSTSNERSLRLTPIIAFICTIKVVEPTLFNKLLLSEVSYPKIQEIISKNNPISNDTLMHRLLSWVRLSTITENEFNQEKEKFEGMTDFLWKENINRTDIIPLFCQKLCMFTLN